MKEEGWLHFARKRIKNAKQTGHAEERISYRFSFQPYGHGVSHYHMIRLIRYEYRLQDEECAVLHRYKRNVPV